MHIYSGGKKAMISRSQTESHAGKTEGQPFWVAAGVFMDKDRVKWRAKPRQPCQSWSAAGTVGSGRLPPTPQWLHSPAGGLPAHTPASVAAQNMETPIQLTGLNAITGTAPRKPDLNENKVYLIFI